MKDNEDSKETYLLLFMGAEHDLSQLQYTRVLI